MQLVYFDTDVFHRIGQTFTAQILPIELRRRILLSPITILEILSHLTLKNNADALAHIQAIHNWVDPAYARLLPWPDAAIAKGAFQLEMKPDGFVDRVERTINLCLATDSPEDFRNSASKLKSALDKVKDSAAALFAVLVKGNRKKPLSAKEFSEVWLHGLAQRTKADPAAKAVDEVVIALSAYHEFEENRLKVATQNPKYKPRANDILDAEQLIYLADPLLHFITCDGGFLARVNKSPQARRIHRVSGAQLADARSVEVILREITGTAVPLPSHYASAVLRM